MASNTTKSKKTASSRGGTKKKPVFNTKKATQSKKKMPQQGFLRDEIVILIAIAISILMMLSNFGIGGFIGDMVSGVLFGFFGVTAYIVPVAFFIGVAFAVSNKGNGKPLCENCSGNRFDMSCLHVYTVDDVRI